ncbi:MAG: acyltransferase [Bradyrhizobium sp.]|nr:MAG: acyltransferase [Bradyrhizobium sp.]
MGKERDVSLDAMRGLAALAVFGWHSMLAFYPASSGYLDATPIAETARSRFWFVAVHGAGAVAFFFVLSGFVLTRQALTSGDTDPLLRGLIKRWPRLAGPTLAATLGSWLLFALGAYFYAPAALLTGSSWFAHFGGALTGVASFQPSFVSAVLQGAALTFLRGDSTYDSSLWTMSFEFYGSLMVYGLAFLLAPRPARWVRLIVVGAAGVVCGAANPALFPFVVGLGLATFLPVEAPRLPAVVSAIVVALALLACGYTQGALGVYAPLTAIWPVSAPIPFLHATGAAALIMMAESWPGMRALLSRPWGRICGELSFPFYLVHLPILCSAGAYVFLATGSAPAAIAATLVVSLAVAWLLALASRWWLARLNVAVVALLASRRQAGLGSIASSP